MQLKTCYYLSRYFYPLFCVAELGQYNTLIDTLDIPQCNFCVWCVKFVDKLSMEKFIV